MAAALLQERKFLQDRGQVIRISPRDMDHERTLDQLKEALQAHHQALELLESTLVEFEESVSGEVSLLPQEEQRGGVQLLSIPQLSGARDGKELALPAPA